MDDYSFENLSPVEFEDVCRDLLQKKLGVQIESFTTGRDTGIDLRFATSNDKKVLIQCKRYATYRSLLSNLKKELEKVCKLKPERYIVCTSVGLTPPNKDEIKKIFSPFIKDTNDIIGRTELNGLLRDYPEVEKQHFKLWFGSTAVLDELLSSRILSRSTFTKEDILANTSVYVPTKSFKQATEIIDKHKYVVISGIPGIGKTTLARMLALQFLAQGYSFIDISFDIDEANERFYREEKQVFYYDDFLGRNFLEEGLHKNEDRRLINFIKRIQRSKNRILFMTTREYILSQAKQKYELFKGGELDIAKCIVDIEQYTQLAKAKILYNHLFFSGLPQEYLERVLDNRSYKQIISHANYNPRLIHLMTKPEIVKNVDAKAFVSEFLSNLNHPTRIWEDAFHTQITEEARLCLFLVALSLRNICERNLFTALSALLAARKQCLTEHQYFQVLKELEGTFILISQDPKGVHWITFANPSIYDFIVEVLKREKPIQKLCIKTARFFNHLLDIFLLPGEKSYNSYQIVLDNELATLVEKRIIEDFELIDELEEKGTTWKRTHLERVAQLSRRFDPAKHEKIRKLCVAVFSGVVIDDSLETSEKEALTELLGYLGPHIPGDHMTVISTFFDTVENSRDAACFAKLRDFDSDSFSDFCYDNSILISNKIQETIQNDVDCSEMNTTEEVSALEEDIDTIECEFPLIDFQTEKMKLNEEREEIEKKEAEAEDYMYQQWKEDTAMSESNTQSVDSEIDSMFDSLRTYTGDET